MEKFLLIFNMENWITQPKNIATVNSSDRHVNFQLIPETIAK